MKVLQVALLVLFSSLLGSVAARTLRPLPRAEVELLAQENRAKETELADEARLRSVRKQEKTVEAERRADLDAAAEEQKKQMRAYTEANSASAAAAEARSMAQGDTEEIRLLRVRVANLKKQLDDDRTFLRKLYEQRKADEERLITVAREKGVTESELGTLRQRFAAIGSSKVTVTGDLLVQEIGDSPATEVKREERRKHATLVELKDTLGALHATILADRNREITLEKKIREVDMPRLAEAESRLNTLEIARAQERRRSQTESQAALQDQELAIREGASVSKKITAAEDLKRNEENLGRTENNLIFASAENKAEASALGARARQVGARDAESRRKRREQEAQEKAREQQEIREQAARDAKIFDADISA